MGERHQERSKAQAPREKETRVNGKMTAENILCLKKGSNRYEIACKGVQFSPFPMYERCVKVMTPATTVKEKFHKSQWCRFGKTILR